MASPSLASSLETFAELVATIETGGNDIADFSTETGDDGNTVATATTEIPIFDDGVADDVDIDIELEEITESGIVVDIQMSARNARGHGDTGGEVADDEGDALTDEVENDDVSHGADQQHSDGAEEGSESDSIEELAEEPVEASASLADSDVTTEGDEVECHSADTKPTDQAGEVGNDATVEADGQEADVEASDGATEVAAQDQGSVDGSSGGPKEELAGDLEPYQDPERLQKVYEAHDTFTEMTEALDVDVTPQTVRRYMIEHEIHEPEPQTAHLLKQVAESGVNFETEETATDGDTSTETSRQNSTDIEETPVDPGATDGSNSVIEGRTATDGGKPKDGTSKDEDAADFEPLPIDQLEEKVNLPDGLCLEEVCEAARDAMTLYDVERTLDIDRSTAREVLHECNLLDMVTGRVSDGRPMKTDEEIHARVTDAVTGVPAE